MKLKLYLTISYVKYIVFMVLTFISIIWIAQVIRYIGLNESFSIELHKVAMITLHLLPNALTTIMPIIIFISSCFFNKHINQTNELSIASHYLSEKKIKKMLLIIFSAIVLVYLYNTEIISVKSYNEYKIQEIDFRNQFKIKDIKNEIYIDGKISLLYEKKNSENGNLKNVTTYLIEENVVIKSKEVRYYQSKEEITFIFIEGERISSSNKEKSYTKFQKLNYSIVNSNNSKLELSKENFNSVDLFKHKRKDFNKAAHRKVIDLIFLILVLRISGKLILINERSNNLIANYSFNLLIILISFTLLAFLNKLFISEQITIIIFYIVSILTIILTNLILDKKYAFL